MNLKTYEQIPDYARDYLYYLRNIRALSPKTVDQYYLDLKIFFRFVMEYKNLTDEKDFDRIDASAVPAQIIEQLTLSDLYVYLNYVNDERGNESRARARKISSLRTFYKFLCKQAVISENPTLFLEPPKSRRTLPVYLSLDEASKLLDSVEGKFKERDYAIITLFLNCGLRLSELVGINVSNILDRNLRVLGKGGKERTLYLNDACVSALNSYLPVRAHTPAKPGHEQALFLSSRGCRICNRQIENIVKKFLSASGLDAEKYSVHKLRHTAATLMHQNGVDVRILQEILGHENLGTTQIYTHLSNTEVRDALKNNPLNKKHN